MCYSDVTLFQYGQIMLMCSFYVLQAAIAGSYEDNIIEQSLQVLPDYGNNDEVPATIIADLPIHSAINRDPHGLHDRFEQALSTKGESIEKQPAQHRIIPDDTLAVDADGDLNLKPVPSHIKTDLKGQKSNTTINVKEEAINGTSFRCICTTGRQAVGQPVELVNSTRLLNILVNEPRVTNRQSPADCVLILFYARYCPFSSMAAPHFNAMSRVFPDIKMAAVDAMKFHGFNTQYGIIGVPTVMLFHNGRPASKFNDSEYTLEMFAKFLTKNTGIEPDGKLFVLSSDFGGPVPSVPAKEFDYCLTLAWVFITICAIYFFSQSSWWKWIVETVLNTWRESEAQHEHVD